MNTSRLWQKVGASVINCAVVILLTLPFLPVLPIELWKVLTIFSFWLYNMIFRARCLGMRMVGTYIEPPTSIWYASLYSLGFATFFYSVWLPGDLLVINGLSQIGSLAMTGNTLHGNLAGQGTMSRAQYLERVKSRARLLVLEGKLHEAVGSLKNDLEHWPDLRPSPWIEDMGWALADEGDDSGVRLWIDGFQ